MVHLGAACPWALYTTQLRDGCRNIYTYIIHTYVFSPLILGLGYYPEDLEKINLFPEVWSNFEKPIEQPSNFFINLEFRFPGSIFLFIGTLKGLIKQISNVKRVSGRIFKILRQNT